METKTSVVFWSVGVFGLVWNIFGVYQFIGSINATTESLLAQGLSAEQAVVMTTYPLWMTIAFAIGVFGGLAGSIVLLAKKALAQSIFLVSLIGYLVLYVGDVTQGVFAALGAPQVIILTSVVLIAAGLWWFARVNTKQSILT